MDTLTQLSGIATDMSGAQAMIDDIVAAPIDSVTIESVSSLPIMMIDSLISINNSTSFYIIVFVWLLIIIWTIKDANYRSQSTGFVMFSLLLVTLGTPLIGLPIYLAIRPLGYKYERAYWKAIMTEQDEDTEEEYVEEYAINELKSTDTDEDHLESLKKQATVAKRRISKNAPSTTKKSSSTSKSKPSSTPKAKKPSARSAQ